MKKNFSFLPLCLALLGLIYIVFILSNYIHYGAEGIYYDGLRRLVEGKQFISLWTEIPLSLSMYFPTTYLLYYPWAKLFGVSDPQSLAYLVRVISPLYFFFYFSVFLKIIKEASSVKMNKNFLFVGILLFLFKEFAGVFCFKPDTHGLFLEAIAFALILAWGNKRNPFFLATSALIFAAATVFKLNMIGIGAGVGLGLLISKEYKAFTIFSLVGLLSLSVFLFGVHSYLGEEHFQTIIKSTGSDLYPFTKLPNIATRTLFQIVVPYLIFFYLTWKSLFSSKIWQPVQKKMISIGLLLSFTLALLGQFKFGAETNYFYNLVFLTITLGAFSYSELKAINQKVFYQLAQTLVILVALRCCLFPVQVITNDLKNYDFSSAIDFIDERYENPRVYTENNNAAAHLGHRSLLASGFFNIYHATTDIKKLGPSFVESIKQSGGVDAFFIAGSGCENFKARAPFNHLVEGFTNLEYHQGKICIFTRNQ